MSHIPTSAVQSFRTVHLDRLILAVILCTSIAVPETRADQLWAGVAKREITDRDAGPVHDPLYAKALVLRNDSTTVVLVTVDAVAIGELGRIGNDFLPRVRAQLQQELQIPPANILASASHCHGVVRSDAASLTVEAVRHACQNMVPVKVGAGVGQENRIPENRRLRLRDGSEADVRRAYSLPPDDEVVGIGPVDPEIGLLRIDRKTGPPLAVVYNFACHPIQGVPSGGNTADFPGFASRVIEDNLGQGAMAFYLQGCAGDINPVRYKDIRSPHDAEPLGNLIGLSTLRAVQGIQTRDSAELTLIRETLSLPRSTDYQRRIEAIQAEQKRLLQSLQGTSLNWKTFLPLLVNYRLSGEFPSSDAHGYLHEESLGRDDLKKLDSNNRANLEAYIRNVLIMEQLTRLQTNLQLLTKHLAQQTAAGSRTLEVEVSGLRIGDFVLITFPGELSVEIGLGIKQRAPSPFTFVASCTNGYIYYAPTAKQRNNSGWAQEDCDCLVAPEWQKLFEQCADALLKKLER